MTNHTLQKRMFQTGAVFCGLALALGAFGAHSLKEYLSETSLETFQTGVRYQFFHGLTIIILASMLRKLDEIYTRYIFNLFAWGIAIFSGSLYLLATKDFTFKDNMNFIGGLTPFGGLSFLSGWFLLAIKGYKNNDGTETSNHNRRHHRHADTSIENDAKNIS